MIRLIFLNFFFLNLFSNCVTCTEIGYFLVTDPGYDVKSALSWVDVHEGRELQSVKLSFPVTQVVSIPVTDSSEQRLHLLIDNQRRGHLFPATEESLALFMKHKENAYFYEADDADQKMHGYGMKDLVDPSLVDIKEGYVFGTQRLWSIVFPSETESITAVVTRRPDEVSKKFLLLIGAV